MLLDPERREDLGGEEVLGLQAASAHALLVREPEERVERAPVRFDSVRPEVGAEDLAGTLPR